MKSNQPIKNFRDLEIWKLGKDIVVEVYRLTSRFPREETYGLIPQMRTAAVRIPAKISEGYTRKESGEYRKCLNDALAACAELETLLEVSCGLSYLKDDLLREFIEKLTIEQKMLRSLYSKIKF